MFPCEVSAPIWLLLVVLAAVLQSPCHRVEAYISGAPPETCDTMLPQHQSLSAIAYSNCATLIRDSLCLKVTIQGVDVDPEGKFVYDCGQDYTITLSGHGSSQRGFMVEFRESSDSVSFDGSLSHVGEFGVASGFNTTTRLECQGHAVTQTVINTAGSTTFVWRAPPRGQHVEASMWVTQVTSSQAYFLPRKNALAIPSDLTCSCPANTYVLSLESKCLPCPENSRSNRGINLFCGCQEGYAREDSTNTTQACGKCFTTSPTNLTVLSSQLPVVLISWTAPDEISEWEVLYRVTAGNTSTNVTLEEGTTMPMAALSNLSPGASYTLHVSAYTESGCLTPPASTAVTVLERCPENPPTITNAVAIPGEVALSYSHPPITDPMIRPEDFLYAVYHRCRTDTGFTLAASGIRSLFYNLQGLPASTMCTARVLVYSVYCPLVYPRLAAEHSFSTTAAGHECPSSPPVITNVLYVADNVVLHYSPPALPDATVQRRRHWDGFQFAIHTRCGTDAEFSLSADGIRNSHYSIPDLPVGVPCVVKLSAYTRECPLEEGGVSTVRAVARQPSNGGGTFGAIDDVTVILAVVISVGAALIILLVVALVVVLVICAKLRTSSSFLKQAAGSKLWAQNSRRPSKGSLEDEYVDCGDQRSGSLSRQQPQPLPLQNRLVAQRGWIGRPNSLPSALFAAPDSPKDPACEVAPEIPVKKNRRSRLISGSESIADTPGEGAVSVATATITTPFREGTTPTVKLFLEEKTPTATTFFEERSAPTLTPFQSDTVTTSTTDEGRVPVESPSLEKTGAMASHKETSPTCEPPEEGKLSTPSCSESSDLPDQSNSVLGEVPTMTTFQPLTPSNQSDSHSLGEQKEKDSPKIPPVKVSSHV